MDSRVLDVWRLTWPQAIPAHEYETALQMAALIGIANRKPETQEPAHQPKPAPRDAVNAKEAAKILGISDPTVYAWVKTGKLRSYATGDGLMVFSRKELRRIMPKPRLIHSRHVVAEAPPGSLKVDDAAKAYGIGRGTLYRLIREGKLPTSTVGEGRAKHRVVSKADVDAYKAERASP